MYEELAPYRTAINEIRLYISSNFRLWDKRICYFKSNEETKEIVNRYNDDGLYSWLHPRLFEDLSFYKEGKKIWILNICHERENAIYEDDLEVIEHINALKFKIIYIYTI